MTTSDRGNFSHLRKKPKIFIKTIKITFFTRYTKRVEVESTRSSYFKTTHNYYEYVIMHGTWYMNLKQ